MDSGATSLYGFVYQIYLSLVTLLYGSVDSLQIERTNLTRSQMEAAVKGELPPTDDLSDVLVALEGGSDVDLHSPGRTVEYIQVKSRPRSKADWTVTDLFTEVIHKLPLRGALDRQDATVPRFTLIVDTGLNEAASQLEAVCVWLSKKPSDITWNDWLAADGEEVGDAEISFPKAGIWSEEALHCRGRELPGKIREFNTLFARGRKVDSANTSGSEEQTTPEDKEEQQPILLTIEQVCAFLSAFRILTHVNFDELKARVHHSLRRYLPWEIVDSADAKLVRYALSLATEQPGRSISRHDFLIGAGIPQQPFDFGTIRSACAAVLRKRLPEEDVRVAVRRQAVEEMFATFLSSDDLKVFVLAGSSRTGKSRQMREWARRQSEQGPVYFDLAKSFGSDAAAHDICHALGHEGQNTHLDIRSLIIRAQEDRPAGASPFILFIDALDEANDSHDLALRLRPVLEGVSRQPIKLVLSCKTTAWERGQDALDAARPWVWQPYRSGAEDGDTLSPTFTLGPFTSTERDEVMELNELEGNVSDEVLGQTLRDPGYLSIYNRLSATARGSGENVARYPVEIYQRFWDRTMQEWSLTTKKRQLSLEECLIRIAECVYTNACADATASLDDLRTIKAPVSLDVDDESDTHPFYAAKQLGLLGESQDRISGQDRVTFVPPYLLEYALMRLLKQQLAAIDTADSGTIAEWLRPIHAVVWHHNFEPILYGLAFVIQELCLANDVRAGVLLSTVLNSHMVDLTGFMQAVSDASSGVLAELLRDHRDFQCRKALSALRSPRSVREILSLLDDSQQEVREEALYALKDAPLSEEWVVRRLMEHTDEAYWRTIHALVETVEAVILFDLDAGRQTMLRLCESYLSDDREHVKIRCAQVLGGVGHRSSIAALRKALPKNRADSPALFDTVIWDLAHLGETSGIEDILLMTASPTSPEPPEVRAQALRTLMIMGSHEALPLFEATLREDTQKGVFSNIETACAGLRKLGEKEKILSILSPVLLTQGRVNELPILWEIGRLHTGESVITLFECLVNSAETRVPDSHWLWRIADQLGSLRTDGEITAAVGLQTSHPGLWRRVEAVAYRLATEKAFLFQAPNQFVRDLRKAGRHLLTMIQSPRVSDAFATALLDTGSDIFSRQEAAKDLAHLGTERDLAALQSIERAHRGLLPREGRLVSDRRTVLINEAAQSTAAIGSRAAFGLYLDFVKNHYLFKDGVDAVGYFSADVLDIQALLTVAEDASIPDGMRSHALYAAVMPAGLNQGLLERLMVIVASDQNPEWVRAWCAKALGWNQFGPAVATLRTEMRQSEPETPLWQACEEALCRLGDIEVATQLTERIQGLRDVWPKKSSDLVWRLGNFSGDENFRERVDGFLVRLIGQEADAQMYHSDMCAQAMQGIQRRHTDGISIPGAIEALCQWLRRPHSPSITMQDDQIAPAILGELDPARLCAEAKELSLQNWSVLAQQCLIEALGQTKMTAATDPLMTFIDPEKNGWLRRTAARSISKIPDIEERLSPRLDELIQKSPIGACAAAETALWFDEQWAHSLLGRLEQHDDNRVRRTSRTIRGWRADREAARHLLNRFTSQLSAAAYWAYGQGLKKVGHEETQAALEQIINDPSKRSDIRHTLLAAECHQSIQKRLQDLQRDLEKKSSWDI